MRPETNVERLVSPLVESHFPDFYREEGPIFVLFFKKYIEWMESQGQSLFHARRIPSYKDIDTTTEEFIVYFKEKYLSGIQLETESNVRQLIKHSLDLYRTKGSERAVDLLFRLVFGVGAEVYYPRKELFILSDGVWHEPIYIEVSGENLNAFGGVQIRGVSSGATAFVERIIRKKTPFKYVDVFFISNLRGNFIPGESINREIDPLPIVECPIVNGSLGSLTVVDGGSDYIVGDVVSLEGMVGSGGLARVLSTQNTTGSVTYTLVDGGYGYTANAQVLPAEMMINMTGVTGSSTGSPYSEAFENLTQAKASLEFDSATTTLQEGDEIFAYDMSDQLIGEAVVISVQETSPGEGDLSLSIRSGDLDQSTLFVGANVGSFSVVSFSDSTFEARILGLRDTVNVNVTAGNGTFLTGERITQGSASGYVGSHAQSGGEGLLVVSRVRGRFLPGEGPLVGDDSGAEATVSSVELQVGVDQVSGDYDTSPNAILTLGDISAVPGSFSSGTPVSIDLFPGRLFEEQVTVFVDMLEPYANVDLDDVYGFPALPEANLSSVIADSLESVTMDIGRLEGILTIDDGQNHVIPPLIRVHDPLVTPFKKTGMIIGFSNASSLFLDGEVVSQSSTGARGMVFSPNTTHLSLDRLSWSNFSSGDMIVGEGSGTTAFVESVQKSPIRGDQAGSHLIGLNARLTGRSTLSRGSVTGLDVVGSGFGYVDGEEVALSGGGAAVIGLSGSGKEPGFYLQGGGFLSSSKRLRDGYYWQEHSYEVRSSVTLSRYEEMLKKVLHVAGTKYFGAMIYNTDINMSSNIKASVSVS